MQGVILAGGLATRLYPVTEKIPKSLVRVGGKPFIDHQIELLIRGGVDDFVFLIGHMGDAIKDHVGDGSRLGVKVRYSDEGAQRLDTAGAVRAAIEFLDEEFFLTFGDSYLILPYQRIWTDYRNSGKEALMVVYRNDNRFDTSDVYVADGLVRSYQKSPLLPGAFYINHGLHVIRRESIARIEKGERMSLQQFLQPIITRGELVAWETRQRFFEIGSFFGLKELEDRFLAERGK